MSKETNYKFSESKGNIDDVIIKKLVTRDCVNSSESLRIV